MLKKRGITFKLIFFILTSCMFIFEGIFGYNYLFSRKMITRNIKEGAQNLALVAVNKIETVFSSAEKIPETMGSFLKQGAYDKERLMNFLRTVVENNSEIYGAAIAFEPYSGESDSLRFAPYFYKSGGEVKFADLGKEDEGYFNCDWYRLPQELKSSLWSEPYYAKSGSSVIMSTYSVPFYKYSEGKSKFMGIVTADISLSWLEEIVSSIKIGKTGYGFLISKKGTIVTHPEEQLIMNETIFSIARKRGDSNLKRVGQAMLRGDSGFVPLKRGLAVNKKCWMVYKPLTYNGWSLGVVFPQDELMADVTNLNHAVFLLGMIGFLFLLLVIILISRSITKPVRILAKTTKDIAGGNLDFTLPQIKSGDEVGRLADSFLYMRDALKKYISELTETTAAKERMESELKIAHDIQMGIVPKIFPPFPDKPEIDVFAVLEPAKEVGGDFFDFFLINDTQLCFVIGDVSDKGVPASLFMAVTKTLIKTTAREVGTPEEILNRVNKEIARDNDSCMFVTVFCGILDIKSGKVYYTNGGHNPPLVIFKEKGLKFLAGARGIAVGVKEDAVFSREKLILEPGDVIYLYTDGVTEAVNQNQELFSKERLRDSLPADYRGSMKELVGMVLENIKLFSKGVPQSDDITILALKYCAGEPDGHNKKKELVLRNELLEITRLSETVLNFGRENNLSSKLINDVNLALEEVINNIISYAYVGDKERRIVVYFDLREGELFLRVEDDGKPFNPLSAPAAEINNPLEEREIGGLGIHFVRHLMDKLEYKREGKKNILMMQKIVF